MGPLMISQDKQKALENAYQAGADAEVAELADWCRERINKHHHIKLNEPCPACHAWEQTISHLSAKPAFKLTGFKAVMDDAYKLATADELDRIVKLIEGLPFIWMGDTQLVQISRDKIIEAIQIPAAECSCDPCGDRECDCWGKRCDYCQNQDG